MFDFTSQLKARILLHEKCDGQAKCTSNIVAEVKEKKRKTNCSRAKKWRSENKERVKAYKYEYEKRPEVKAKRNAWAREWNLKNPEKKKAQEQRYYEKHKDEIKQKNSERLKKYMEECPDKIRANANKRSKAYKERQRQDPVKWQQFLERKKINAKRYREKKKLKEQQAAA